MNLVITGASRGMGKAIANIFAGAGYNLVLVARNQGTLEATAEEFRQNFPNCSVRVFAADLADKAKCIETADAIIKAVDTIDVLVNNAGTYYPGSIHNEPDGSLETLMGINLYSAYHFTRQLLPVMMGKKSGHIFNICSIASLGPYPNGGAYSISKFALAGFSRNLREEMKTYNIKVTTVYPGAVFTDSWAGSGVDPDRIMEANDIASLVFAASQLSVAACVEEIIVRPQLGDL